eukprot:2475426-Pyramimonas_sp.AAC.1
MVDPAKVSAARVDLRGWVPSARLHASLLAMPCLGGASNPDRWGGGGGAWVGWDRQARASGAVSPDIR